MIKLNRRLYYNCYIGRSVNNKIEDVKELIHERQLHLLALIETWHEDSDCITIKKHRSLGLNVLKAARPILKHIDVDDLAFINHGGIAVVSRPGIMVVKLSVKVRVTTFEHLCFRATIGGASSILIVLYRPGSSSPS